jgi:signal transduction histidine kinase
MTSPSSIREQHDISSFERERRLAATRLIALVFLGSLSALTVLFAGFALVGTVFHVQLVFILATIVMLLICVALYGFGVFFAGRGRLQISVLTTLGGALLSIILITIFWKFLLDHRLSDVVLTLLAASGVGIVLASAIGDRWMIYATTVVMNLLTVVLVGLFPLASGEEWIALAVALNIQWATAAITIATSGNYRRTLDELGSAYAQVQRLDDLKDQFITNINHELRTPIMTLQGYVEYLRLSRHEMDGAEEEEMFARASRAGYNLVTLLSSILDNRRIDQNAEDFTPVPVPVYETLQAALLLLDPRESELGEHDLQIKIHRNVMILGESVRLQQILINLISNAIKYSPPATPILIAAHVMPRTSSRGWTFRQTREALPEQIEIIVRDWGLGIPPDQIQLLFNRFVRLPRDLASTIVGNGLGLYLCRVLARAMGGDVWVESTGTFGEGSTFHVILPSAMTPDEESAAEATDPRMQVISVGSPKKAR